MAKFRAARRMWAKLVKERYNPKNPKSLKLRFHAQTAGVTLQAEQPLVNVSRVTLQALAAVLGGTQSLHTNSYDEALALPTEDSARIALRTQQVIAHESGVASSVDPLGGSYLIEQLTDQIESRAMEYIKRIDDMGGAVKAIEENFQQREIERRAYEHQLAVEKNDRIVVGVNDFRVEQNAKVELAKVDGSIEVEQKRRLKQCKDTRDRAKTTASLKAISAAITSGDNVVDAIVSAVKAEATVGEVADVLRHEFGEHKAS